MTVRALGHRILYRLTRPPVAPARQLLIYYVLLAPVAEAVRRGATEVWAMRSACCASPKFRLDSLTAIIAQTFGIAVERTRTSCESAPPHVRMHVWSIDAGVDVRSLDFSATGALIDAA